jgi:diaminopimelate epimerase
MDVSFNKYHGCGNDFICVDFRGKDADFVSLAKQLCRRHFSIGADGLIVLLDSAVAHYRMVVVNADGSIPEMCGNGLRCFVAYVSDLGLAQSSMLTIETGAGVLKAVIQSNSCSSMMVLVDMGLAYYHDRLPSNDFALANAPGHVISIGSQSFEFTPVSMGNPHCVIFVSDVDAIDLQSVGPMIETHPCFPNRVNVEFVQVVANNHLKMRVWERGVGETNACGTGACASVVAGVLSKKCDTNARVDVLGGSLGISFCLETFQVEMTGPATFVFSSKITI